MAPKNKTEAVVETPETVEEATDYASKVTVLHQKHAEFIKAETGIDVDPLAVFLVYSTRVKFRKTSDKYAEVKQTKAEQEAAKEAAKEEAKAAREEAAKAKAEEREKAKAEKAEAKAKADAEKAEAKAEKERLAAEAKAAKDAAAAEKAAASEGDTATADKPAKARRGKGKTTSADAIKEAEKASKEAPF